MDRLPVTKTHYKSFFLIAGGSFFDGFDLYLAGGVLAAMAAGGFSSVTGNATFISFTFIGLYFGTLLAGYFGDKFGRKFAMLAGIGVTWYTWLEQGRHIRISPSVLRSIARVLMLNEYETLYLFELAKLTPEKPLQPIQTLKPIFQHDKADTGYRKELKQLGFAEKELLIEFGYPTQRFVLPPHT